MGEKRQSTLQKTAGESLHKSAGNRYAKAVFRQQNTLCEKKTASIQLINAEEFTMVEQKRFELSTYTMRTYRSSQLSYCPLCRLTCH